MRLYYSYRKIRTPICKFREKQLRRLDELAALTEAEAQRLYSFNRPFLQPGATHFRVALCAQLAAFLLPNANEWVFQFVVGVPLAGTL